MIARVRRFLESRWLITWAIGIAILLTAPGLFGGFQTEDWVFRSVAESEVFSLPWRVNLWAPEQLSEDAIRGVVLEAKRTGSLPWLTDERFYVSLWRPLGSWTHHLDYRLYPDAAVLMHVQNVLWYGLLVASAALLYRRLLVPRWAAGLSALFFAADDAHGHAVGWISNRSAIMAAGFGVLALYFFDRWRRDGWRPGAWLTPSVLALSLSSSEFALGVVGYFVAHALFLDPARPARRVFAALAWIVPLSAWAVAYRALGHGASRSGMYLDPLSQPLGFLRNALERASVLLLGELGLPPSDLYGELTPPARTALALTAGLIALGLGWFLLRTLRKDRAARFFGLGMLLSIIPASSVFPEDRMLLCAGLGGAALVAGMLGVLAQKHASGQHTPRPVVFVAGALLVVHAIVGPLLLPIRSLTMWRYERRLAEARDSAFALVEAPDQELVLLNAPDFYFGVTVFLTRLARGEPVPAHAWCLSGSLEPISVRRLDGYTIELFPERGFMSEQLNHIYRDPAHPMHAEELVWFEEFQVRVSEVNAAGEPLRAKFRFRWPLDDRRMVFAAWRNGRYERVELPEYGAVLKIRR